MANVSVPGGIVAYRTMLRRRGGVVALIGAASVALSGGVLLLLPGRLAGLVGFALLVASCPVLVAFGVPIASGLSTIAIGVAASLALWFVVGQLAAHLATREAVADWRTWWAKFAPFAVMISRHAQRGGRQTHRRSRRLVIRHHDTATIARISASFAGPMPRTASRSSTVA